MASSTLSQQDEEEEDIPIEDPSEELMDIEEIEANSNKINRCGKCRRVQFGHPMPYGIDKCQLDVIIDDGLLAEDDKVKLDMRRKKRGLKRQSSVEDDGRNSKRSNSGDDADLEGLVAEGEKLKKLLARQKEDTRKALDNKLKKIAEENIKAKEELEKEQKKTSEILGGAKQRKKTEISRERRSRSTERRGSDRRKISQTKDSRRMESPRRDRDRRTNNSKRMESPRLDRDDRRHDSRRMESPRLDRDERRHYSRRMESPRRDRDGRRNYSRWMDSPREGRDTRRYDSRRMESPGRNGKNRQRRESSQRMDSPRRYDHRMSSPRMERDGRRHDSRRMDGGERDSSIHSNTSQLSHMMENVVQAVKRVGDDQDKKLDPPPGWDTGISVEGWSRSVLIWAEAKAKPERKVQALVELLKKEKREGVKEMVVAEVVENSDFDYKAEDGVERILKNIKELLDESRWSKISSLVDEFKEFKQKDGEGNKEFVSRFSTLESRLKNEKVGMTNMWLAAVLLKSSGLSKMERNNVLATTNVEDEDNVLKVIKKKMRDVDPPKSRNEPTDTLYGNNRNDFRSNSRGRDNFRKNWKDNGRSRSRSGFNNHRSSSRGRNDQKKSFQKDGHDQRKSFQKDGQDQPKLTYHCVTLKIDRNRSIFENEVENKALIDSGCPEMVAGKGWIRTFESSVGTVFDTVDREGSFKFGNDVFPTLEYKLVPIRIGKLNELVEVGVIDSAVPLLISKTKLKEWGAELNFKENTIYLEKTNEKVHLQETKTGHLVVRLGKNVE